MTSYSWEASQKSIIKCPYCKGKKAKLGKGESHNYLGVKLDSTKNKMFWKMGKKK